MGLIFRQKVKVGFGWGAFEDFFAKKWEINLFFCVGDGKFD